MPDPRTLEPDKQPGFAVGKRVWFAREFNAEVFRKRHGLLHAVTVTWHERMTETGKAVEVTDGAGVCELVPVRHLRLSAPKGHRQQREAPKAKAVRPRKEAVDPRLGYETTVFDHLEAL